MYYTGCTLSQNNSTYPSLYYPLLSVQGHSFSVSLHASVFFRYYFHGIPSSVYSRKRGNVVHRTLCFQNTINSFYPVASNIFFPTSTVALMALFRTLPFLDFVKDPLRNPPQLHAVCTCLCFMCLVSVLIIIVIIITIIIIIIWFTSVGIVIIISGSKTRNFVPTIASKAECFPSITLTYSFCWLPGHLLFNHSCQYFEWGLKLTVRRIVLCCVMGDSEQNYR